MFSLELPQNIIRVEGFAFNCCRSLRNIALASNIVVNENAFLNCKELFQIFDTEEAIVNALKIRFDGLLIHGKIYHNQMSTEVIQNSIIIGENGELDPTGLHQDCLGMTPLHILACSTVQCLEMYQLMVDNYPANLIVEDVWGAVPLLYAVRGNAPSEIVHFLVNSYQSLYPDHEFNWSDMVIKLGRAGAPKAVVGNLLDEQQTLSPEYNIDWDHVFRELRNVYVSHVTFCFLTRFSIAMRVNAIGVKHFRDVMDDYFMASDYVNFNRQAWHDETLTKLEYYESEHQKLKESTSLLELALWKARISSVVHGKAMSGGNKKMKIDQSEFRLQCRISCGADHVVKNVWPYLLPPDFVRSYGGEDNSNEEEEDDDDDGADSDDNDEVEDDSENDDSGEDFDDTEENEEST
jgi:hypothetical protein